MEQQLAFGAQIPKQNRGNTFFKNQRGEFGIAQPSAKKTEQGQAAQFMFEEKSEYIHSSVASSLIENKDFAQHQFLNSQNTSTNCKEESPFVLSNIREKRSYLNSHQFADFKEPENEPMNNPKSIGQDENLYLKF